MPRRPGKPRDQRLVSEYVKSTYPDAIAVFNELPLGPPIEELRKRYPGTPDSAFRRWKPRADAIVILADRIIAIEGKVIRPSKGMGDLIRYRDKVKQTPELQEWANLPLELQLVTPREDPMMVQDCGKQGITYVLYQPEWAVRHLMEFSGWRY